MSRYNWYVWVMMGLSFKVGATANENIKDEQIKIAPSGSKVEVKNEEALTEDFLNFLADMDDVEGQLMDPIVVDAMSDDKKVAAKGKTPSTLSQTNKENK